MTQLKKELSDISQAHKQEEGYSWRHPFVLMII